ncbi:thioredoxin family protein [Chitinophaga polysaccharea]|uniref:thioredoxin family protein n=1 Tax=Chitinophaga polysaccharea TaxID=1293035 RepID=UPI001455A923|nr:thioredoxin family protein [Chitinophaga polysaccharea]NLR58074.1 thioredoxin family protein [Chitinophaga polysaccharea]
MRSLLLSFWCLFAIGVFSQVQAQQAPPAASQVVKEACSKAGKNNKKVFVIFHASWCGWCHRMDTAMNDASCKKYFTDNYEIRHITVLENGDKKSLENPGGFDMLAKYNGDKEGIPFWLILSPAGELLADSRMKDAVTGKLQNVGCPAQKAEVDYFITLLEKTSRMKTTELDAIRTRFSKIAPGH